MNAYHLLELLVVAAAVAGSLYAALARLAPQLLGRKRSAQGKACNSCDACGGCATPGKSENLIHWRR